ncbi:hypothetical protein [Azospirillum largimobile]
MPPAEKIEAENKQPLRIPRDRFGNGRKKYHSQASNLRPERTVGTTVAQRDLDRTP